MDMDTLETTLGALPDAPIYNVKAVCHRTGITAARLRAWERRYHLLLPNRSAQNYRLYSERDIGILFWLLDQTRAGVSARNAMDQLRSLMAGGTDVLVRLPVVTSRPLVDTPRSPETLADEVTGALIGFKGRRADEVLQEAAALYTTETVLINVLRTSLAHIRALKADGDVNTANEQYAVNYIRQRLINMLQTTPIIRGQRSVLLIGFSDERTEIDILILALLLRRQGWITHNLGNDLEPANLMHTLSIVDAGVVLFYADEPKNARKLFGFPVVQDRNGNHARVVVCGRGLEREPHMDSASQLDYLGYDLKRITAELSRYLGETISQTAAHPTFVVA